MKRKNHVILLIFIFIFTFLVSCSGKDKIKPKIYFNQFDDCLPGSTIDVSSIYSIDDVDGVIVPDITIISPDNKKVDIVNNQFIVDTTGEYKIKISSRDKAGNEATEEIIFNCTYNTSDRTKAIINISEYNANVLQGDICSIPDIEVLDSVDDNLDYKLSLIDPNGNVKEISGDFIADIEGIYILKVSVTNTADLVSIKTIQYSVSHKTKEMSEIDGIIDNNYQSKVVKFGGLRGNEVGSVYTYRNENGLKFGFDLSSDKQVSEKEKIELFLDSKGINDFFTVTSLKLSLYPDGKMELVKGTDVNGKVDVVDNLSLPYSSQIVCKTKLLGRTTLEEGNSDDEGWVSEAFIPYGILGLTKDDSVYFSIGYFSENDNYNFDGMNYCAMYPDVNKPFKYLEFTKSMDIINGSRRYSYDASKVDCDLTKDIYKDQNSNSFNVGGLRNLEKAFVNIYRDKEGFYFGFDVKDDKNVNSADRFEIYFNAGDANDFLVSRNNFKFSMHASGFITVSYGHGNIFTEFYPDKLYKPQCLVKLNSGTTLDNNTDVDNGYSGEIFIPYSFFSKYSRVSNFDYNTRIGITFGIWRASSELNEIIQWDKDQTKDWDGWSYTEFADPIYPKTYPLLLSDCSLASSSELLDVLHDPIDDSVDGILDEEYWNGDRTANLSIEPTTDLAGINIKIFRDKAGIRLAFLGNDKQITKSDIILLYISTKDSYYEIGKESDSYKVYGKYPNQYDYRFRIGLDRTLTVYKGQYKDWAQAVTDLSSISLEVNKYSEDYSYIAEMFIPYSFLSCEDYTISENDTLGYSVRLAGENSRGSTVLNNLYCGSIYCDSASPASYARIDKDGKVFAAITNNSSIRLDGEFDEEIYSQEKALVSTISGSLSEIYKCDEGLVIKTKFGSEDSMRFVFETLDHKLDAPYVYDYQITLYKNQTIESSFGNSKGFYSPDIYTSYVAPRAVFKLIDGKVFAEALIPYAYLSRYNTTNTYTNIGYMMIDKNSQLRFSFETKKGSRTDSSFTYNNLYLGSVDCNKPKTYIELKFEEA